MSGEWLAQLITAISVALLVLEKALARLAPKTQSTLDDRLLAALRDLKGFGGEASAWVRSHAPAFFAVVEDLERAGIVPRGSKADEFLRRMRSAYERLTGEQLPLHAEEEARLLASGLSAAEHLSRDAMPTRPIGMVPPAQPVSPGGPAGNPQIGPPSK